MVGFVIRGAIILWAALMLFLGVRGILDPGVYAESLSIRIDAAAANTLRADLSAFFIVGSVSALLGAILPSWHRALLVPASLFGTALLGRLIGVTMGDFVHNSIVQAMIIEALSLILLGGGWLLLERQKRDRLAGDVAAPHAEEALVPTSRQ